MLTVGGLDVVLLFGSYAELRHGDPPGSRVLARRTFVKSRVTAPGERTTGQTHKRDRDEKNPNCLPSSSISNP